MEDRKDNLVRFLKHAGRCFSFNDVEQITHTWLSYKGVKEKTSGQSAGLACMHKAPALSPTPYTIRCALVHSCHLSTQTAEAGGAQGHPQAHSMLKASLSVTRPVLQR